MIAAKAFDPVVGVDIHMIQPPGPVPPVPIPHPFVGMLVDPMDFAPIIGATVMVNGMPRATAGTGGKCIPPHIPIGGTFIKPPGNECEVFMGSATVLADGDPLSRLAMPALSCHDIGMPSPPRVKKKTKPKSLELPTSVVLAVPMGPPVLVGGPPTISLMALGMKAAMAGLGAALKKLKKMKAYKNLMKKFKKAKQKAFKNMKPGFLKCKVLKAEPVNLVTGEVFVEQQDFALRWRVPLDWTRFYRSGSTRRGVCGSGWETPADARLEFDESGTVSFRDGSAGAAVFPLWPVNGPVREIVAGSLLVDEGDHYAVRTQNRLTYLFPKLNPLPLAGELPVSVIADSFGNWIQFARTGASLDEIRESSGIRIAVTSVGGRIQRMLLVHPGDEPRLLVTYQYHGNDLVAVYDANGKPYRFAYDNHRLARHTNRVGLSFYYEYDGPNSAARCLHSWGDGGLYDYRFAFEPTFTSYNDSLGNRWLSEHSDGLVTKEIDPLGATTSYVYDERGRTVAVIDPNGLETTYAYDAAGNTVAVVDPAGNKSAAEYDENGALLTRQMPDGATWKYVWKDGLLRQRVSPTGGISEYEYEANGDLVSEVSPAGTRHWLGRDSHGRIVSETDPLGRTWRWSHDGLGNTIEAVDPTGSKTSYVYDPCGRCVQVRRPSGRTEKFEYDADGNAVAITDPSGATTRAEYVGLGEVSARIDADGSRTAFRYDNEERLVAVVSSRFGTFELMRDAAGRVIEERDYWGAQRQLTLDAAGRILRSHDALGRTHDFEYDDAGRVTARTLGGDVREEFEYDGAGRRIALRNAYTEVVRKYDGEGRLVGETQNGFTFKLAYGPTGRLTGRTSSLGNTIDYRWNPAEELTAVIVNGETILRLQNDAPARTRAEQLGRSVLREEAVDPDGHVRVQRLTRAGEVIVNREYTLDADGRPTAMNDSLRGNFEWQYDAVGRRTQEHSEGQPTHFHYGSAGGLLVPEQEQRENRELRAARYAENVYRFDAAGQLRERQGPAGTAHFEWDPWGRLAATRTGAEPIVRFSYDAAGRRVEKESADGVDQFFWESNRLLAERSAAGWKEYVYYPDSWVLLAIVSESGIAICNSGPNGSPWECVSPDGSLIWSARYQGLGEAATVGTTQFDCPLRLQGQYADRETGLYYNRHRYYDPVVGSYISQDPLRLAGGEDLYSFGFNTDEWIDPLGLACYSKKSAQHVHSHGHAANSPHIPNKSRFRPTEGGQKFTDEVINHPNVVVTHQGNGRIKYEVADLANPPATKQRVTGWDQAGNPVHGGTVVVEGPTPASWSTYSPDEVVTQFPT